MQTYPFQCLEDTRVIVMYRIGKENNNMISLLTMVQTFLANCKDNEAVLQEIYIRIRHLKPLPVC